MSKVLVDLFPGKLLNLAVRLGLRLIDVKRIEMECSNNTQRVKLEIIKFWLMDVAHPKPSWEVLREALLEVQPNLADNIPHLSS